MEHIGRYRTFWKVARALLAPWIRRKFNYTPELCTVEGPCLVLANHNLDWDPLILACGFPEYMSFVSSEHIFRWGLVAKLLIFFLNPIARQKGTTAADTAMTMLRRLRKGVSVAMFAEGNRSFNGLTGEILPSTGKLARSSGATLITYRIDGGYFTAPRWCGNNLRRGRMTGKIANIYTPAQLKAMSADEVNAAIVRDLFVDAYAVQRSEMTLFRGKRLAEGLETVLCLCPKCGRLDTLHSENDTLRCDCGFSVRYNPYGFIEGDDAPFDSITDWDSAQTQQLCALADTAGDGIIFSDDGMLLKEIFPDHSEAVLGSGSMALYADRLECCGHTFPLAELSGFSLHGPQTADLSIGGRCFEISAKARRCTRKYMLVIAHLRSGEPRTDIHAQ